MRGSAGSTLPADVAELNGLLVPAEPPGLILYPVSRRVNSVRNDDRELLEPLAG